MIDSDQSDSGKTLKKFLSSDFKSRLEIATYWIERNKKSSNAAIQAILGKSLNNNKNNNNIITLRNATLRYSRSKNVMLRSNMILGLFVSLQIH